MSRALIVNILLGLTIAFLPLFRKVSYVDIDRMSKDNLFLVVMISTMLFLPKKLREAPCLIWGFFVYAFILIIINQWEPASINVFYQSTFPQGTS